MGGGHLPTQARASAPAGAPQRTQGFGSARAGSVPLVCGPSGMWAQQIAWGFLSPSVLVQGSANTSPKTENTSYISKQVKESK